MNIGPGRPRGGHSDAKQRILVEARSQFVERGYAATTLRSIAVACAVDVALISYHYGSKRGLFAEAVRVPVSPADVLDSVLLDGPLSPHRLLTAVIDVWENPRTGPPLRALADAALTRPTERRLLREYLERELVPGLARRLTGRGRERRARAAVYVVAGVVLGHYVLGLNEASSAQAVFADALGPLTTALAESRG
jgi:AcrR family transcriptional regulator